MATIRTIRTHRTRTTPRHRRRRHLRYRLPRRRRHDDSNFKSDPDPCEQALEASSTKERGAEVRGKERKPLRCARRATTSLAKSTASSRPSESEYMVLVRRRKSSAHLAGSALPAP